MTRRALRCGVVVGELALATACGSEQRRDDATASAGIGSFGPEGGGSSGIGPGDDDAGDDDDGSGTATGVDDGVDDSGGTLKLDVASADDGADACDTECCAYAFSIIWVANTDQGTVSKIDTHTLQELGRYDTHPSAGGGLPSRTSVNLLGDVAVTNRQPGGVVKIASREERCFDANGDGTIQTSHGANEVLPWGQDECVLWYRDVPTVDFDDGPRPTAWEGGNAAEDPCTEEEPRLWIGFKDGNDDHAIIWRLDGATGVVLDDIDAGFWSNDGDKGPYGGAVTKEGDFVVTGKGDTDPVIRVDAVTLDVDTIATPTEDFGKYGMALDQNGNLWIGSHHDYEGVHHYDFGSGDWSNIDGLPSRELKGVAVDGDGSVWIAGIDPCALVRIDAASGNVIDDSIALPGCSSPLGVSIDADGFVWVVDRGASKAYKVDPDTLTTEVATGLVGPYTYSDMTGAGLGLVVNPPG